MSDLPGRTATCIPLLGSNFRRKLLLVQRQFAYARPPELSLQTTAQIYPLWSAIRQPTGPDAAKEVERLDNYRCRAARESMAILFRVQSTNCQSLKLPSQSSGNFYLFTCLVSVQFRSLNSSRVWSLSADSDLNRSQVRAKLQREKVSAAIRMEKSMKFPPIQPSLPERSDRARPFLCLALYLSYRPRALRANRDAR